jgi:rsbT co-antagonist protein RsbR
MTTSSRLPDVIRQHESEILGDWVRQQVASGAAGGKVREADAREQSRTLLAAIRDGLASGNTFDIQSHSWAPARELLADVSRSRARQGFTPVETSTFVFSLKLPLFSRLRQEYSNDAPGLAADVWTVTELIDRLGLFAMESYQKTREEVIVRQQQE